MSTKTFSVCPEAKQPTIRVNTYGDIETFTFRRKAQADKRIMELLRAGYTFDATRETTKEAPPLVAECAICYGSQPCHDDGEALICIDRPACQARCREAIDPVTTEVALAYEIAVCGAPETDEQDSEFHAQRQVPAPTCCNCAGPHPTWRCPQVGAELMRARHIPPLRPSISAPTPPPAPTRVNWSSRHAPMPPVEALRLAVTHGIFALDTLSLLRASLEAADEEVLVNAEQLAAARTQVAVNLEMHRVEAAVFDLPF